MNQVETRKDIPGTRTNYVDSTHKTTALKLTDTQRHERDSTAQHAPASSGNDCSSRSTPRPSGSACRSRSSSAARSLLQLPAQHRSSPSFRRGLATVWGAGAIPSAGKAHDPDVESRLIGWCCLACSEVASEMPDTHCVPARCKEVIS